MTVLYVLYVRLSTVVMKIVVAVGVVQLLWACHPTRSIVPTAHAFQNVAPATTLQTDVSNRRFQTAINFCHQNVPDRVEIDFVRRSEKMTKLSYTRTTSLHSSLWEERSGMASTSMVTSIHTTRRDSIKTIASFVFSTAVLLGVAAFPTIARSTTADYGNNDKCQTVCMYKCLQRNTSSSSRSTSSTTSSSLSSTCTEQFGSTNAASSSSMACSSTSPETTMTREPKLVQSSRIDNLYETWQDKFCIDKNSICEDRKQYSNK